MTPWRNDSVPPSLLRPCNEASHKKLRPGIICTLELIFNFITEIPNKDAAWCQATVVLVMWVPLCKDTSEPFPQALSSGQMTMTLNLDHTHTSEWDTECVSQPRKCLALLHKWIVPFYWGSSNTLATWCKKLTHWKRPWFWERLRAGGEGDDRGWDDGMASLTQWTWVWANSRRQWRTGKPSMLWSMWSKELDTFADWTTSVYWIFSIKHY